MKPKPHLIKDCGVLFFTDYAMSVPLLVVALHSLYGKWPCLWPLCDSQITVVYGLNTPEFFIKLLHCTRNFRVNLQPTSINQMNRRYGDVTRRCWNVKPLIHKESPYNITLFYDCDHVFFNRFDPSIFDIIKKSGLTSCSHPWDKVNYRLQGRSRIRAQLIRQLNMPCGDHLPIVNGGCVGSVKGTPLLNEWESKIPTFGQKTCHILLKKVADEFALAHTMEQHGIEVADPRWSYSPWTETDDEINSVVKSVIGIHYAAGKYQKLQSYKAAFQAAYKDDYLFLRTCFDDYLKCNIAIQKLL